MFDGFEGKERFACACRQNNRAETIRINPRLQPLPLIVVEIEIKFERWLDGSVFRNGRRVLDTVFAQLLDSDWVVQRKGTPFLDPCIPLKVRGRRLCVFSDNRPVVVAEINFLFFAHNSSDLSPDTSSGTVPLDFRN